MPSDRFFGWDKLISRLGKFCLSQKMRQMAHSLEFFLSNLQYCLFMFGTISQRGMHESKKHAKYRKPHTSRESKLHMGCEPVSLRLEGVRWQRLNVSSFGKNVKSVVSPSASLVPRALRRNRMRLWRLSKLCPSPGWSEGRRRWRTVEPTLCRPSWPSPRQEVR